MSNFDNKLTYGHYGESIVKEWIESRGHKVLHHKGKYPYDMDITKPNGDEWKTETKCKIPYRKYPNLTGFDMYDWEVYQRYDINKFYIFIVDYSHKCVYGDTLANMITYANTAPWLDSTKTNPYELIVFEYSKMQKLFKLTEEQIIRLKILESEK